MRERQDTTPERPIITEGKRGWRGRLTEEQGNSVTGEQEGTGRCRGSRVMEGQET